MLWFCGMPGLGMGDLIDVDMDALEGEGVIRLSNAEYLTRPLRLDSSEASALIVALRALREGGDDDVRPIVDRTLDKLEAAAGEAASVAAQVDIRMPEQAGRLAELRERLSRAVEARRQVRLDYYVPARDESTERVVDPLRVVTADGNTYLSAYCHLAEDQRLFRLDRISTAEVLDTPVEEHADLEPRDLADGIRGARCTGSAGRPCRQIRRSLPERSRRRTPASSWPATARRESAPSWRDGRFPPSRPFRSARPRRRGARSR